MSRAEIEKITNLPYAAWVEPHDSRQIVLSSRLRLARNLAGRPFPNRLDDTAAAALAQEVADCLPKLTPENDWQLLRLDGLQSLAVMINEEDHLRMQVILPGLQLAAGWQQLSVLDDKLALGLDFAYDDKLGFLTSCPSNLGTGLRASVMLHLPALHLTNKLEGIFRQLPQVGLTVRGVYGEGSQSLSGLYQISNQISLGYSEDDIISRLQQLVEEIIANEMQAREWLRQNRLLWLQDRVGRAVGVLANAWLLSSGEAMEHISMLRLGLAMGLCDSIGYQELNLMMLSVQTPFLQVGASKELNEFERDQFRAALTRRFFSK